MFAPWEQVLVVPVVGPFAVPLVTPTVEPVASVATSIFAMSEKPLVDPHVGDAPTELIIDDLVLGTGEEAGAGRLAVVHYVGVAMSSGEQFDSSWDRDEPFSFPLGAGYVIKGWDQGVQGMRVVGRRRLAVPAHLGYGDQGAGGVIAPGEVLIFVVDLLELR